jgi:membrane-associated PAP2 superfamily phosphatase
MLFSGKSAIAALFLLFAELALFESPWGNLDLAVQDLFFDFERQKWLLPSPQASSAINAFFYLGPKILIITLGIALFLLALFPRRWREKLPRCTRVWRRRDLLVAVLTLATAPLFVGFLKGATNVHYPCNIERYGGNVRYVRTFERFPEDIRPAKRERGFPAGHASGGFALLALAGMATTRRGTCATIAIALAAGWWMGSYQMLRGVHYLSHTVTTMLLCWLTFLAWRMLACRASMGISRILQK